MSPFRSLKQRIRRLELSSGGGEIRFRLTDGTKASMRRRELLDAMQEALSGGLTRRARTLLSAVRASDGSHLHECIQALAAGPVPPGEIND